MSSATVVVGVRGIENVVNASPTESELPRAFEHARATLSILPLKKGERLYVSPSKNFRFQVSCPPPIIDMATGERRDQLPISARFETYLFRTSDPKMIAALDKGKNFGIEYFDAAIEVKKRLAAVTKKLVDQFNASATEEDKAALLASLQVERGQTSADLAPREVASAAGKKAK